MKASRVTLCPGEGTHQERAEEDEGDKIDVGQVGATALVLILPGCRRRVWLTALAFQAGEHDLLPCLTGGTPAPTQPRSAAGKDAAGKDVEP